MKTLQLQDVITLESYKPVENGIFINSLTKQQFTMDYTPTFVEYLITIENEDNAKYNIGVIQLYIMELTSGEIYYSTDEDTVNAKYICHLTIENENQIPEIVFDEADLTNCKITETIDNDLSIVHQLDLY